MIAVWLGLRCSSTGVPMTTTTCSAVPTIAGSAEASRRPAASARCSTSSAPGSCERHPARVHQADGGFADVVDGHLGAAVGEREASGRPTWPQPPITTTWRSNWPDSDVPVIVCLPICPLPGRPGARLTPNPTASSCRTSFVCGDRLGPASMPLSCTRVAGTVPLLPSVNSKDVRRAPEEYKVGRSEATTPVAEAGATPPAPAVPSPHWWAGPRPWAWTAAFAAAGLALFAAYLRQAQTVPVNSDGASNALQAWDMLHGNLLLRGWTVGGRVVLHHRTARVHARRAGPRAERGRAARVGRDHLHAGRAGRRCWPGGGRRAARASSGCSIAAGIMLAPQLGPGVVHPALPARPHRHPGARCW